MTMKLSMRMGLALLLFPVTAFAGQSLVLTPGTGTTTVADPNLNSNQDWRVEFQMHNWGPPNANNYGAFVWDLNGIGANAAVVPGNSLWIIDKRDSIPGGAACQLSLEGRTNVLVRVQREFSKSRFTCEIWNSDGTNYGQSVLQILAANNWPYNGGGFGGANTTASLGFFKIFLSTVVDGSQPPITSTIGNWTDFKFDGNVLDDSGNGHNITFPGAVFTATPQQLPAAIAKTQGAPSWTNALAVRAGFPVVLDGTNSFSLADQNATLSYFWQQISGPTTAIWSNRTPARPSVSGLIFGNYVFRLRVTDASGVAAQTDLNVGAVATDDKGVVVNADPRLDAVLGPMIAFGKHPWSWVDYSQQLLSQYWASQYDVNGGPWALESDLSSLNGVARNGTITTSADGSHFFGTRTNFLSAFCGGVAGPVVGSPFMVPRVYPYGASSPYLSHPRQIASCNSDTDIVTASGWNWDQGQITSPVSWGTYGLCSTCGNWGATNSTGSNLNFYDSGAAYYAYYYRSGLSAPKIAGEWMADRWIHAPLAHYGPPRDLNLVSTIIRAALDPPSDGTQLWPAIRPLLSGFCNNNHVIGDPREDGWCLVYYATAALFDPDPTQQAIDQAWLVAAYNNIWGPQQQSDGSYITNQFEGDGGHSFIATNGSNVMTVHTGTTPLPASYCGEDVIQTRAGTVSVGADLLTVTGTGTSFSTSGVTAGMIIEMTGTRGGVPWGMNSIVGSVTSNTSLTLQAGMTWRGDYPTTITSYRVYNSSIGGIGYYQQNFGQVDSAGNLTNPLAPDTDNWYACSVTGGGSTITLDKPYTGNTSGGNIYRRITTQDINGRGTQPYMVGISAWGENIAAAALATYNPIVAANYTTSANKAAAWYLSNAAYDPVSKGEWYAVGFSNCQALVFTSFGCSGTTFAQARDYGVEGDNIISRYYLSTHSSAIKSSVDLYFTSQYAAPGFTSPFQTDGTTVDLLGCCDAFTQTKYFGQVFTVGQAYQWPAARLGGVSPPSPLNTFVGFALGSVTGAASVQIIVTQPSSAQTTVACSSSPCEITLDKRQGAHWYQIVYLDGSGQVLAKSDPELIQVQIVR